MSLNPIWTKVKSSPAVLYPCFRLKDKNVLIPGWSSKLFKAEENYFEIRITEQFLKDRREYWNEYNPLTIILSEFIYGTKKNSFPFVVGPDRLKGLEQLKGHEHVRYKNTRVTGPAPYRGGQISLFLGLFRIKSKDWAREALSLLENVAKAFDSSKLSSYLSITDPLIKGFESFLGMDDQMQFRLGFRNEFEDPASSLDNQLKSGFYVLLRTEDSKIQTEKFWLKENQLFYGEKKTKLELYHQNDFVLFEISNLNLRNDYTTFDFHEKWIEIQKLIWTNNDKNQSIEAYQHLISLLRTNTDLIDSHKKKLQLVYRANFQQEWELNEKAKNPLDKIMLDKPIIIRKSIDQLTKDKSAIKVIRLGNELLSSMNKDLKFRTSPKSLSENDIENSLKSNLFNENLMASFDLNNMSSLLSSELF